MTQDSNVTHLKPSSIDMLLTIAASANFTNWRLASLGQHLWVGSTAAEVFFDSIKSAKKLSSPSPLGDKYDLTSYEPKYEHIAQAADVVNWAVRRQNRDCWGSNDAIAFVSILTTISTLDHVQSAMEISAQPSMATTPIDQEINARLVGASEALIANVDILNQIEEGVKKTGTN